jgi:proline dehydrogenase
MLLRAAESQWLANQMTTRTFSRRAVRRFMPGEALDDALGAAAALAPNGIGSLITQLGEALTDLSQAGVVRDHYVGAFDSIKRRGLTAWVSVKPTQLGLDLAPETCRKYLTELADKAEATGSSLWLDMEDSRYVDRTIDLYRAIRSRNAKAGIAIQAYLRRTPSDIDALLPLDPAIRLVKGAYAEPPSVAFASKRETDLAFFDVGRKLLTRAGKGGTLPVFGTHDILLIDRLIASAKELGVPTNRYEVHMLYGIRTDDQLRLAKSSQTVKTLISYGAAWFKWYMRRLAERPANVWFVVKSLVA